MSATTDFFDTHLAQCKRAADLLRAQADSKTFVDLVDGAVTACQAAIARGRRRSDMPAVVIKMPAIVAKYEALPAQRKAALAAKDAAQVDPAAAKEKRA